jgi:hypothetical protein
VSKYAELLEEQPIERTKTVRDISVTERGSFRTCHRQWYLETVLNLEPRGVANWAFAFGTGLHAGLEAYYKFKGGLPYKMVGAPTGGTEEITAYDWMIDNFHQWYEKLDKKIQKELGPLAAEMRDELLGYKLLGEEMLDYYDQFASVEDNFKVAAVEGLWTPEGKALLGDQLNPPYSKHAWPLRHPSGRIMVPIVHPTTKRRLSSFKRGGQPVFLSARLDLIVFRMGLGLRGFWVTDHKSTASAPSDRGIDFEDQITGYCYVFWRLTGIIPRGTVFNYLVKQVPKEPRRTQTGTGLSYAKDQLTTPEMYKEALIERGLMVNGKIYSEKHEECYRSLLAYGWDRFFRRFEVQRNEHELMRFEERLYEEYHDMLDAYKFPARRAYPNQSYMHCPGCSVNKICQAIEDGSDYEWLIENAYQEGEDRKAE